MSNDSSRCLRNTFDGDPYNSRFSILISLHMLKHNKKYKQNSLGLVDDKCLFLLSNNDITTTIVVIDISTVIIGNDFFIELVYFLWDLSLPFGM